VDDRDRDDDRDDDIRELLTAAEHDLYEASLPGNADKLSDDRLRNDIDRCRQARDKARDLYQRQSVSSTAKRRSRGEALVMNQRTGQKAEILADALARLEAEAAAREACVSRNGR
jgi:hypothetical protein